MSWIKKLGKSLIDPDNIATSIILAIVLLILISIFQPILTNRIDARVYTHYDRTIREKSTNNVTLYFVVANIGNIPLEITDLKFMWVDDYYKDNFGPHWIIENVKLLDDLNQDAVLGIVQPYEKIKIHTTISKPKDLKSELQLIQLCMEFTPTEKAYFGYAFGTLRGICNKWINLYWK